MISAARARDWIHEACVWIGLGFVLGCLLGMATGCAPQVNVPASLGLEPIRVLVSVEGGAAGDVVEGVEGWARTTRGLRDWELTGDWDVANVALIEVAPLTLCSHPAMAACTAGTRGLWTHRPPASGGDPMRVFLVAGKYEARAATVAMHELGHNLGLAHMAGTLMSIALADAPELPCPDRVTVIELGERLGVAGLQWCE